MRGRWVFTIAVAVACGGGRAPAPVPAELPAVAHVPAHVIDAAVIDAGPPPPALARRGERCGTCADGLACLAAAGGWPGGYCASACEAGACDGTCVPTGDFGDVCMTACTGDDQCRVAEGYTCDPVWHACSLPNVAAIVPRQCGSGSGGGNSVRDPTFGDAEPIAAGRDPAAALAGSGALALVDTGDAIATWPAASILTEGARGPALAVLRAGIVAVWRTPAGVQVATVPASTSAPDSLGPSLAAAARVLAPLDDCGDCAAPPLLAANGDVVYALYGGAGVGLRARRSRDGGKTFDAPFAVAVGTQAAAAVDRAGALHVASLRGDAHGAYGSAMQSLDYAVVGGLPAAPTPTSPSTVSARDEKLPSFFATPALAVDAPRERVWIAYVRGGRDAVWDVVIAASRDGGRTWTRAIISDGCSLHALPALALDPRTGVVHAAWLDTAASPARFAHATCTLGAAGPPSCTPRGAISSQPFASLSLGRFGATYLGSRSALLLDDARRTLHAFWPQPLADGVHVMHAAAKLR